MTEPAPTIDSETPPKQGVRYMLKRLGPLAPLAILTLAGPPISSILIFASADTLLAPWLKANMPMSVFVFMLLSVSLGGIGILSTYMQALLAGYSFGLAYGFSAVGTGVFGAAIIGYVIGRAISGERLTMLLDERPKMRAISRALLSSSPTRTLVLVMLLRLMPNAPFAMSNLLLASLRVRLSTYLFGTVIGLLPRIAAATYVGSILSEWRRQPVSIWQVGLGIACAITLVFIIQSVAKKAVARMTTEPQAN
ncbi:MAG TPA: VTT domain-containing protein [Tepidisphaeraceae bacterium]|nr:VTT domain-containing protein [Tepidisphaeraceae bacterium]